MDLVARGTVSAGLLLFRHGPGGVEVLLGHMGGPFWAKKDDAAWSIPKGEHAPDEDPRDAAIREFAEEMGSDAPDGPLLELGSVRQRGGKVVTAFALHADFDATHIVSNEFTIEWPPRSGRIQSFPELDRAEWFDQETARRKLVTSQSEFIDRLLSALEGSPVGGE
ncbi:NUDIX domain-containing protein [Actinomycetes bacterium KLBMP 9759]